MFINYPVHEFFAFIVVHELALVHELSEFIMRVHEQNKFMNSHESLICCSRIFMNRS